MRLIRGVGCVGDGEEGYDLIFEEGSEWFEKIDKSDDWNDKDLYDYLDFLYVLQFLNYFFCCLDHFY